MKTEVLTESNADFGRNNLSILLTYESLALISCTIVHFATGGLLYASEPARVVYGAEFVSLGGYMVLLGFVSIFYVLLGLYGARFHNRAVIIIVVILLVGSMAGEVSIKYLVDGALESEFHTDVKDDCLSQVISEDYEDTLCPEYFNSNRTLAFWGLWVHWHEQAGLEGDGSSGHYQQILLQVQSQYACCGFSRPQMCRVNRTLSSPDTQLYDANVDPANCGAYQFALGTFQPNERWYPPTADCDIIIREVAALYSGGCPFDLPYGSTCVAQNSYGTNPYVTGCAAGMEDFVTEDLYAISGAMEFTAIVQAIVSATWICFFFKRKFTDVTPVQSWQVLEDEFVD